MLGSNPEMVGRVAYNIALAEGVYSGAIPEVVLRWAEAFYKGREVAKLIPCRSLIEHSADSIVVVESPCVGED